MNFDTELVGKIGSMALIDSKDKLIDYTQGGAGFPANSNPDISGFPAARRRSAASIT